MDNFDLKKYLVENKVTTNSRMISENKQPEVGKKEADFRKVVKKIIQINENNSWQDYVEKTNMPNAGLKDFHSYEYIREAAGEVLYEFTIGLKKFLEENGITVLDNSREPHPESTVSFSYNEDIDKKKLYRDPWKALYLGWNNNDKENKIFNNIVDYYNQHKDKISAHGLTKAMHSTGIFFKDKDESGSKMMNEVEAPESITVKLTDKGKNEFNLYTTPGAVKMFPNVFYNFGNTNFELLLTKPMQFQILLAIYYPDIKEIQISTIRPATNKEELNYDEVGELMRARQFNSLKIRGKELNLVPQAYCKFENGFEKGMKDHRGYFEIL